MNYLSISLTSGIAACMMKSDKRNVHCFSLSPFTQQKQKRPAWAGRFCRCCVLPLAGVVFAVGQNTIGIPNAAVAQHFLIAAAAHQVVVAVAAGGAVGAGQGVAAGAVIAAAAVGRIGGAAVVLRAVRTVGAAIHGAVVGIAIVGAAVVGAVVRHAVLGRAVVVVVGTAVILFGGTAGQAQYQCQRQKQGGDGFFHAKLSFLVKKRGCRVCVVFAAAEEIAETRFEKGT